MKIYFCDGCNESIPLTDIQAGQVTTIKGKLFCRNCIPPGGSAPPPAAGATGRPGTHPLVMVLLLGLIGYVVWRDLPRLTQAVTGDAEAVEELRDGSEGARWEALDDRLAGVQATLDELERKLAFQRSDIDAVRGASADLSRGFDRAREDLDGLLRGQAETGQFIEKLHLQENRTGKLEERINVLADLLARQEQQLQSGLVSRSTDGEAQSEAAPAVDATQQAALEALRRQLLDPDAGTRFDAVDKIGRGRLKQLAPNLLPVLGDPDSFVRILAMQVLGDFGAVEAVPALFDVLDDPNPQIRKTAAEALQRLTGYDAAYDPRASKAERDRAVKKWRELVGSAARPQ